MSRKSQFVGKRIYDMCEYILDYCDELVGCSKCILDGIKLDQQSHCPIYVIAELRDRMIEIGANDDEKYQGQKQRTY